MSVKDLLLIAALYAAMHFMLIAVMSWVLHYFVALRAKPDRRALWTTGIPYLISALAFLAGGPEDGQLLAPIAALPGFVLTYWFWRNDFRKAWLDGTSEIPEGTKLANDDWRVGLLIVVALVAVAAWKAYLRSQ